MTQHHNISTATIRGLWNNWAIAFGAIALVTFFSLFISKVILPAIIFVLAYVMMAKLKSDSGNSKMGACNLIVWATAIILFWSGLIMVIINIIHAEWFFGGRFVVEPFNPQHPYVASLIIFPTALAVSIYFLARGHSLKICQNCHARFGYYHQSSSVATLYFREARYQLRLMLMLSLLLSIVDWGYYYFFYINVNFNSPDKFYFIIMPIAVYLISLVYMSLRYMSMSDDLVARYSSKNMKPMMTLVRFLVLSGDRILLSEQSDGLIDTPVKKTMTRREEISLDEARHEFADMSGTKDFDLKFLYSESGYVNGTNVIHFAAFLPDAAESHDLRVRGQWNTIDQLDRQLKAHKLTPLLMSELHRIYNITMAWKTYDRDGRRLYPIKNYHPTFRLRDFKKWDVDYTDLHWLDIASNNEDRPLFRLRRFWRKNFRH
ncbi:MAG: hypothetical protein K2M54_03275 [Muribaculaceae bacterium]|nr:hypothetical protein [Muribaculaceae bacterium]MDE7457425.1 hypothetical protein [Muribaculaceae bacterium]